ncbi:uncharacterized protein LOC113359002 [Papaver somniferum]|uniref:uncharacterized protein LOC113359002 n=1 Tax=Papaver somniferum TaxID=3469 RepID=UPI000E6F7C07|nr:uncharacterized protein LOC113359002 [Papaver somniferum]
MQGDNVVLSLLIPGKKQPGRDIDIYLRPLIDDLIKLWNDGVEVYDSYSKTMFNLKALLMWTINDFPAYGSLSGCTYKGKAPCPICGDNTLSNYLPVSRKTVYMNHRRFLPDNHSLRSSKKKACFNGEIERKENPPTMSGVEAFQRQSSIVNDFGKAKQNEAEKRKDKGLKKNNKNKKVSTDAGTSAAAGSGAQDHDHPIFNKRSIFFDLPYWKVLLLRHNIDVIHTEKNVCESLISTILNIKNKTKDGLNSHIDLKSMGIREDLHPKIIDGKTWPEPGPYNLSDKGKGRFYNRMRNLKVPYGYSSDLRRHFWKDGCLGVLKAHDYHVLMQQILPVALKGLLPDGPSTAINRLCSYFNEICQRVVDLTRLLELEEEIAVTLCMLEMYFPPSFFDVMIHLKIHLAREVRLCGPVQYRWMYPFERYMKIFKEYVKNYAQPEACITECYLGMEYVRYLDVHTDKADEGEVNQSRNENIQHHSTPAGRPISKGVQVYIGSDMLKIAHRYVLFNTTTINPYRTMHMDELRSSHTDSEDQLLSIHSDTFADWIRKKVQIQISRGISVSSTVQWLASGPLEKCVSYKGLQINGSRFITKDIRRVTQNNGVSIESKSLVEASQISSGFYGVLEQILVLDYQHMFQIPIFKCDWAHTYFGVKQEKGFRLVNLCQYKNQYQNDPFILASQTRQVFYSRESNSSNWFVMLKPPPRGFHELEKYNEHEDTICLPVDPSTLDLQMDDEPETYARDDAEPILVVPEKKKNKKNKKTKKKCR